MRNKIYLLILILSVTAGLMLIYDDLNIFNDDIQRTVMLNDRQSLITLSYIISSSMSSGNSDKGFISYMIGRKFEGGEMLFFSETDKFILPKDYTCIIDSLKVTVIFEPTGEKGESEWRNDHLNINTIPVEE